MLTIAKLKTYQKFKGDAAAWKLETGGADSSGILDDDWLLIKDLVFKLNLQWTGQLNPEILDSFEAQLLQATADDLTCGHLNGMATDGWFTHPILGTIIPELRRRYWYTQPLVFEGLGFHGQICAHTNGEPPFEAQFDAMVKALNATAEMKQEMVNDMFNAYNDHRSAFIEAAGECDLAELNHPNEIWKTLTDFSVSVGDGNFQGEDHRISTTFSFRLKLDPDHEINVEYRGGQIYDVVCEG
jgi:hypothetical protein